MTYYYKDAVSIVIDGDRDCYGKFLGFSELEWDKHLETTKVVHLIEWEDKHEETRPDG